MVLWVFWGRSALVSLLLLFFLCLPSFPPSPPSPTTATFSFTRVLLSFSEIPFLFAIFPNSPKTSESFLFASYVVLCQLFVRIGSLLRGVKSGCSVSIFLRWYFFSNKYIPPHFYRCHRCFFFFLITSLSPISVLVLDRSGRNPIWDGSVARVLVSLFFGDF